MLKNKWLILVVIVVVVLAGLWYTGVWQNLIPAGSDESAAAANAMKVTTVATAMQKTVADISIAIGNKDSTAIQNLAPEFATTVDSISTLAPQLKRSIDNAINKGQNVSASSAAYGDLMTKLSYLESSKLTLQNAAAELTNLNGIYSDISAIKTNMQQVRQQ